MKKPIEWSKFKDRIISLSKEGKTSGKILDVLKEKHGDIFPNRALRRIQHILQKNNPDISP